MQLRHERTLLVPQVGPGRERGAGSGTGRDGTERSAPRAVELLMLCVLAGRDRAGELYGLVGQRRPIRRVHRGPGGAAV